jgi:hypothetical protein
MPTGSVDNIPDVFRKLLNSNLSPLDKAEMLDIVRTQNEQVKSLQGNKLHLERSLKDRMGKMFGNYHTKVKNSADTGNKMAQLEQADTLDRFAIAASDLDMANAFEHYQAASDFYLEYQKSNGTVQKTTDMVLHTPSNMNMPTGGYQFNMQNQQQTVSASADPGMQPDADITGAMSKLYKNWGAILQSYSPQSSGVVQASGGYPPQQSSIAASAPVYMQDVNTTYNQHMQQQQQQQQMVPYGQQPVYNSVAGVTPYGQPLPQMYNPYAQNQHYQQQTVMASTQGVKRGFGEASAGWTNAAPLRDDVMKRIRAENPDYTISSKFKHPKGNSELSLERQTAELASMMPTN